MQCRHALLSATAVLSGFSGCIAPFTSSGSLREVSVELRNADDGARTFHLALETEAGMLDWGSHRVDAGVDKLVTMAPDEAAPWSRYTESSRISQGVSIS